MSDNIEPVAATENVVGSIPHAVPPMDPTPTSEPSNQSFSDLIPQEYKDKGYMSKIQDVDGLFKAFDNAQSMIGKRPAGVPQENASQEEWDKFYQELGRPDTPDGYEVKTPEEMPEGVGMDDKALNEFKSLSHELGLNSSQMQKILDFDIKRQSDSISSLKESSEEQELKIEKEFEELAKKTFGDRTDDVIENGRSLLSKYVTNDLSEKVQDLDNSTLMVLSSVLDGIAKDYIGEDNINKSTGNPTPQTAEQAHDIMKSVAFRDPFDPGHADAKAKVSAIYSNLYK